MINDSYQVPTSGEGGAAPKELKRDDVNFFDYDGTLLYAYTWEEAKNLAELPVAPSHDGMTFSEWNYTLEDIKAQSSDTYKGKADIGATFIDGNGIQVENPKGVIIIPRGTQFIDEQTYSYMIVDVLSIPNTVNTIAYSAFFKCCFKDRVVVPSSVEEWDADGYYSFYECSSPYVIWDNTRKNTKKLNIYVSNLIIEIPEWYTDVDSAGFAFPNSIVLVPKNIKNLYNVFGSLQNGVVLYFAERDDIPYLAYSLQGNAVVVVPDNLYDD